MSTAVDFRHHLLDHQDEVFINASLPLDFLQDGLVDKTMPHSKNDNSRIIGKISFNEHAALISIFPNGPAQSSPTQESYFTLTRRKEV